MNCPTEQQERRKAATPVDHPLSEVNQAYGYPPLVSAAITTSLGLLHNPRLAGGRNIGRGLKV
jgi:hypothetical protein